MGVWYSAYAAPARRTLAISFPAIAQSPRAVALMALCATLVCGACPAKAQQYIQQGPKLVGSGASSPLVTVPGQGQSVGLSANGNTAITGAPNDGNSAGAAWVFTRGGGAWSQQGAKLVGSGAVGNAEQGQSVALSGDGNTAIVGGYYDNGRVGAAWVFTQSGGTWTQQGDKLVGSTSSSEAYEGDSVALSVDGNTAIIGGPFDVGQTGAAWIFTRSGTTWTQQTKLVGAGAVLPSFQGAAVALSADGKTAIVGGYENNTNVGAVWVYTNNGGTWSQQTELIASDTVGQALFGWSVSLSADGNVAVIGGPGDDNGIGATWIFARFGGDRWAEEAKLIGYDNIDTQSVSAASEGTAVGISGAGDTVIIGAPRNVNDSSSPVGSVFVFNSSSGSWRQQDDLYGSGDVGVPHLGTSVAMSPDGNTIVAGGPFDNTVSSASAGASWVFIRTAPTNSHDFNDDGNSDILWLDTSGDVAMWLMNGASILQSAGVGTVPTVWSIAGQHDFNGDGKADILWHDTSGDVAVWLMNGATISQSLGVGTANPSVWSIVGTGDFFGNGNGDVLWRDSSGDVAIWELNGATIVQSCGVGTAPTSWSIVGTGDFNGDGKTDILWHDTAGDVAIWEMNGCTILQSLGVGNANPSVWSIAGTGDFNGDGMSDILWHDTSGDVAVWLMNGATIMQSLGVGTANPSVWSIAQTGDYYGAGTSDILWRDTSGDVAVWKMNGATITQSAGIGTASPVWSIQGAGAD